VKAAQQFITIVLLPEGLSDDAWIREVAKDKKDTRNAWMCNVAKDEDRKDARTVFLQPTGDSFNVWSYTPEGLDKVLDSDLHKVAAVMSERIPNETRFVGPDGSQHNVKRPSEPAQPVPEGTTILSLAALDERIRAKNHDCFRSLVEQLRSPLGVIPFVGAGMSAAFKENNRRIFPEWGELLRKMARDNGIEKDIEPLVESEKYEHAAALLQDSLPNSFQRNISNAFDL
jgi:hypothetical protein